METLKPEPKKPAAAKDPSEEIAVYELRFCVQNGRDIGIDDSNGGGKGLLQAKPNLVEIAYLPRRRFYRVTEHRRHDRKGASKTIYIPESWATFEPLPE